MKGYFPTPPETVDAMVEILFGDKPPAPGATVLDPGSGAGAFVEGVLRWCHANSHGVPRITALESDPRHIAVLNQKFADNPNITVLHEDFLFGDPGKYDYIVGNPPYVGITGLDSDEKSRYRTLFATARGRFDLYMLFFERAMSCLAQDGRLVFITPEKFLYVESASVLRSQLAQSHVESIWFAPEDTFGKLVTYPVVTSVRNESPGTTRVLKRDGSQTALALPQSGASWLPLIQGQDPVGGSLVLADVCRRISCGVATGADSVFVFSAATLDPSLKPFARPTVAGRDLIPGSAAPVQHNSVMLMPYDDRGRLLPLSDLGDLGRYLKRTEVRKRLMERTCANRKPWYAFHETPMLVDMLRPKILLKDITARPEFWIDWTGEVVPRHSVYYIVPQDQRDLPLLLDYLRSSEAAAWLDANCHRAAKGFLRLQSRILQRLPIPDGLAGRLHTATSVNHGVAPVEVVHPPAGRVA